MPRAQDAVRRAKLEFLEACKRMGLFDLAREQTARMLRILAYHGFSETMAGFRPKLLARPDLLRARLALLRAMGIPILPLDEALDLLREDGLPPQATVITFDDGFFSTYRYGLDIIRATPVPVTSYITTYYVEKQGPIYGLAVQYMFWRTDRSQIDLCGLGLPIDGWVRWSTPSQAGDIAARIARFGEAFMSEEQRRWLARELGDRLEVSYDALVSSRELSLLNADEIRELCARGIDVQLHTHRHRLPQDEREARREIDENRARLEPLAGRPLNHLCYPSGVFEERSWPWLEQMRIASATTTLPGLNETKTPRYRLKRILDGDNVEPIEFEAEICGFAELMRRNVDWYRARSERLHA
jgi:peptidoglycan/xylan/chitin deacetylase (PgdA/CDA1 family)